MSQSLAQKKELEDKEREISEKKSIEKEMELHQQETKQQLLRSLSKRAAQEYHQMENSLGMKLLKAKAWLQTMIHQIKEKLRSLLKK